VPYLGGATNVQDQTLLGWNERHGHEVSTGVAQIAAATEQDTAAMRETKQSSRTVREIARQLQGSVRHFSVN